MIAALPLDARISYGRLIARSGGSLAPRLTKGGASMISESGAHRPHLESVGLRGAGTAGRGDTPFRAAAWPRAVTSLHDWLHSIFERLIAAEHRCFPRDGDSGWRPACSPVHGRGNTANYECPECGQSWQPSAVASCDHSRSRLLRQSDFAAPRSIREFRVVDCACRSAPHLLAVSPGGSAQAQAVSSGPRR